MNPLIDDSIYTFSVAKIPTATPDFEVYKVDLNILDGALNLVFKLTATHIKKEDIFINKKLLVQQAREWKKDFSATNV